MCFCSIQPKLSLLHACSVRCVPGWQVLATGNHSPSSLFNLPYPMTPFYISFRGGVDAPSGLLHCWRNRRQSSRAVSQSTLNVAPVFVLARSTHLTTAALANSSKPALLLELPPTTCCCERCISAQRTLTGSDAAWISVPVGPFKPGVTLCGLRCVPEAHDQDGDVDAK